MTEPADQVIVALGGDWVDLPELGTEGVFGGFREQPHPLGGPLRKVSVASGGSRAPRKKQLARPPADFFIRLSGTRSQWPDRPETPRPGTVGLANPTPPSATVGVPDQRGAGLPGAPTAATLDAVTRLACQNTRESAVQLNRDLSDRRGTITAQTVRRMVPKRQRSVAWSIVDGLEDKRAEVAEHFRAMGAGDERLYVHTGPAPAPSDTAVEQLRQLIGETGATLAVIDTLLRFVRVRDVADYAGMTAALDPLLILSRETACHVMAVYHAPKVRREGLDAILGSVVIAGTCDTGLVLDRKPDGRRTLVAVQRYGSDLPETVLELEGLTRTITAGGSVTDREREQPRMRSCGSWQPDPTPRQKPARRSAAIGARSARCCASWSARVGWTEPGKGNPASPTSIKKRVFRRACRTEQSHAIVFAAKRTGLYDCTRRE